MIKFSSKKASIEYALVNEDFSDLTVKQIAEVFDVPRYMIYKIIKKIEKETGEKVKYFVDEKYSRRGEDGERESALKFIERNDISGMTIEELSQKTGCSESTLRSYIYRLKKKGIVKEYKRAK